MPGGQILSLLALLFLLALSFQDVSAAVKTGDWITRENKDSFKEAFKWGPQPWSLEDNQKYCRNTAHYVTLDENIPNYTDTINQAVRLMNTKGGGTVFLGYGTFIVTAPIELLSGVCLFGKGSKNTTIKLQDKAPPFGSKSGLIRASGAEYIYLDKFAIDGNRANQDAGDEEENRKRAGIHFTLVNFVRMFDLKIVHNSGNAVNIRGEGNSLFSSHIGMEQIHVWGNGEDAFSISQTATASVIHGSAGENGRHGIVVSSSKYVWLWNMDITRFAGENVCGVAIRDNSQDILVQGIKIQDTEGPIMAGICARNSSGIIVKDGVIVPYPDDATAVCYHLRSLTGFEAAENYCGLSDGDNVDTDGSVVVPTAIAVPPPKEKRKELVAFSSPTPTPDPSFRYIVIDVLPPTPTPSYFKNTLKISSRPSST